ncbi:MAG TPA: LLM class flavin-dependent oxidoreductase [Herpetosiphonaceae bacterium]
MSLGQAGKLRDRLGISIGAPDAATLLDIIVQAESSGVRQVWMTQGPTTIDSLTLYAAAGQRTSQIRFGTSIVPTYPRHPLALAQQAATIAALTPGRIRLGVGPSHRPAIEPTYGIKMESPLVHLREYIDVLRGVLWEGRIEHSGQFITANATLSNPPEVPLLISTLGEGAFRLAGEVSDGAISWNCPPSYLQNVGLPAMQAGAQAAGRPVPPLVAHVWVSLSRDVEAVRQAARKALAYYPRLPFYANMFAAAGYPVENGQASDALIDSLVVMGDNDSVAVRLQELLDSGLDELLLTSAPVGDEAEERARLFDLVGQL